MIFLLLDNYIELWPCPLNSDPVLWCHGLCKFFAVVNIGISAAVGLKKVFLKDILFLQRVITLPFKFNNFDFLSLLWIFCVKLVEFDVHVVLNKKMITM